MDLLEINAVSHTLGLPADEIRGYWSRFVLFVPAVRTGALVRFPPEGVTLLGEIHDAVESGATFEEIEASLQEHYPVTIVSPAGQAVLSAHATPPTVEPHPGESPDMNQQEFGVILATLRELPTAAQIRELRDETATLRTTIVERETQRELARTITESELTEISSSLRREMAKLREELQAERSRWSRSAPDSNGSQSRPPITNDSDSQNSSNHVAQDSRIRTPRRMGQPLRPSNSNHK